MSELEKYSHNFLNLNTAKRFGFKAPHKAILLLSVIESIECGLINNNRVELTESLEAIFLKLWEIYVGDSIIFQPKIATPFWHLQNEPFWNLYLHSGENLNTVRNPYSVQKLRLETVAFIDGDLYRLLKDSESREKLKKILIRTYLRKHCIPDSALSIVTIIGTLINIAA